MLNNPFVHGEVTAYRTRPGGCDGCWAQRDSDQRHGSGAMFLRADTADSLERHTVLEHALQRTPDDRIGLGPIPRRLFGLGPGYADPVEPASSVMRASPSSPALKVRTVTSGGVPMRKGMPQKLVPGLM